MSLDLRIDKDSPVPLRRQISAQIVGAIYEDKLKPGETVPSIRALSRRLRVGEGTVAAAYKELVTMRWLAHKHARGSFLVVESPNPPACEKTGLDDIIDDTIRRAIEAGHSRSDLRQRVRERLDMAAPDHVLIVEDEPHLRSILHGELAAALSAPVESVGTEELEKHPEKLAGALAVFLQVRARRSEILRILPRSHPYVVITSTDRAKHVELVRTLKAPSVIAIVSISPLFLDFARSLLAPFSGKHGVRTLLAGETPVNLPFADLVICDTVVRPLVQRVKGPHAKRISPYRVISSRTVREIRERLTSD